MLTIVRRLSWSAVSVTLRKRSDCLRPDQPGDPARRAVGLYRLYPHRFVEKGAGEDLACANRRNLAHTVSPILRW